MLRYSNTPEIINDLRFLVKALEETLPSDDEEPLGIPAQPPSQTWAMTDRLSKDQIEDLIRQYHAGRTGKELAEAFNISLSSVRRLLAKHKARLKDGTDHEPASA